MKKFNELTKRGQEQRLAKYEAERQARGTQDAIGNVVKKPTFKTLDNGATIATFRIAFTQKGVEGTQFENFNAYIKPEQDKLLAYYQSVGKGQLVSVEFKVNEVDGKVYRNIWTMFNREKRKQ